MLKKVKRMAEKSESWRCFVNRVRYITNQSHPHHKLKKVVQAAVNFGCRWGQTARDFIRAVHETQKLWKIRNSKGKGGGNPTKDIFFEIVYSAPKGLRTRADERAAIDQMITAPFRDCPNRRGWHLAAWDLEEKDRPKNWKDIDDAHYLFSARDNFGRATISDRFGDGRETLESWMLRMDEQICHMLNETREKKYEPVRPIYLRRLEKKMGVKMTKLYEMIANHTAEPVIRENLVDIIEDMQQTSAKDPIKMEPVAKVINENRSLDEDKLVWILFNGRQMERKYRIEKLLLNIAEAQLDIELSRPSGNEDQGGSAGGNVSLPSQAENSTDSALSPQKHPARPTAPVPNEQATDMTEEAAAKPNQSKPTKGIDIIKNPSPETTRALKDAKAELDNKYKDRRKNLQQGKSGPEMT